MRATLRAAGRTHRIIRSSCAKLQSLPNRLVTTPAPRSLRDLRHLTPARVGLGRSGGSLPTRALLDFTLDHARARDAVHSVFDAASLGAGLGAIGLRAVEVSSLAVDRTDYLK